MAGELQMNYGPLGKLQGGLQVNYGPLGKWRGASSDLWATRCTTVLYNVRANSPYNLLEAADRILIRI